MAGEGAYQLEVLLELRRKEREAAEAKYSEMLSLYHQAGEILRNAEDEHRRLIKERRQKTKEFDQAAGSGRTELAALQGFEFYLEGLKDRENQVLEELDRARNAQRKAQGEMRRAHQEMLAAIKALMAVEKHFEKWKLEQKTLAERRQSNQMDDVAARVWREQRS